MEFQKIYKEYAPQVYRFLLSLTSDAAWAEELTAVTFYQAFLHIKQFEGRSSLYSWLCQIGKNAWIKECKKLNRQAAIPVEEMEVMDEGISLEGRIIRKEQLQYIQMAMQKIKSPYIDVFIMHVFGELKLKEIAEVFGKTESWARVTYYRAKEQIIEKVKEMGYENIM